MTTDDAEAPPNAMLARRLIREVAVAFARRNGGRFNLVDSVVDFQEPAPALELAGLLSSLHCTSVIVTLRPFTYTVSWTLPVGA